MPVYCASYLSLGLLLGRSFFKEIVVLQHQIIFWVSLEELKGDLLGIHGLDDHTMTILVFANETDAKKSGHLCVQMTFEADCYTYTPLMTRGDVPAIALKRNGPLLKPPLAPIVEPKKVLLPVLPSKGKPETVVKTAIEATSSQEELEPL